MISADDLISGAGDFFNFQIDMLYFWVEDIMWTIKNFCMLLLFMSVTIIDSGFWIKNQDKGIFSEKNETDYGRSSRIWKNLQKFQNHSTVLVNW